MRKGGMTGSRPLLLPNCSPYCINAWFKKSPMPFRKYPLPPARRTYSLGSQRHGCQEHGLKLKKRWQSARWKAFVSAGNVLSRVLPATSTPALWSTMPSFLTMSTWLKSWPLSWGSPQERTTVLSACNCKQHIHTANICRAKSIGPFFTSSVYHLVARLMNWFCSNGMQQEF